MEVFKTIADFVDRYSFFEDFKCEIWHKRNLYYGGKCLYIPNEFKDLELKRVFIEMDSERGRSFISFVLLSSPYEGLEALEENREFIPLHKDEEGGC